MLLFIVAGGRVYLWLELVRIEIKLYFHIMMKTFQMQNNFEHMYLFDTLHVWSTQNISTSFQGCILGGKFRIFTPDSESEVYF